MTLFQRAVSVWLAAACAAATPALSQSLPPAVLTTQAEAQRRLPNTVSDVRASIEAYGRDLPGTSVIPSFFVEQIQWFAAL